MGDDPPVVVQPLQRRDPPMLGEVMISGRLASNDTGVVYAGQLVDQRVAVVMLTEGAETDSFGRARFDAAVQALVDDADGAAVAAGREADIAPWVALPGRSWSDALASARRVLAAVTLDDLAPVGAARGPQFRPHWFRRDGAGRWRVWPLPWPSALTSAGRWTIVAAFGLMLAIAAVALWIATLVFENQPPAPPPPQVTRPVPPPPPLTLPNSSTPVPPTPSTGPPRSGSGSSGPGGTSVPPIV